MRGSCQRTPYAALVVVAWAVLSLVLASTAAAHPRPAPDLADRGDIGRAPWRMTRPDRGDIERDARAVMMVGLPGRQLDTATAAHLYGGGVGIIIFQKNITTASQVRALTSAASCAAGGSILVSVDQEIGRVARLGGLVTATPSTAELAIMTNGEIEAIAARLGVITGDVVPGGMV